MKPNRGILDKPFPEEWQWLFDEGRKAGRAERDVEVAVLREELRVAKFNWGDVRKAFAGKNFNLVDNERAADDGVRAAREFTAKHRQKVLAMPLPRNECPGCFCRIYDEAAKQGWCADCFHGAEYEINPPVQRVEE